MPGLIFVLRRLRLLEQRYWRSLSGVSIMASTFLFKENEQRDVRISLVAFG